jgi:hypothetical protein
MAITPPASEGVLDNVVTAQREITSQQRRAHAATVPCSLFV